MAREGRLQELREEFSTVVAGRSNVVDAVLPPLTFVLLNALAGFGVGAWGSLGLAAALAAFRLIRGQTLAYALGGLAATGLAILAAGLSDQAGGYFLPNLINGALTTLLCLVSVIVRRPLVALTSHLARGWPLRWYWHRGVRAAYSEVTLAWAAFFALRLGLQWMLFREGQTITLGVLSVVMGWPATIALLVASYLYGTWRLRNLNGPSVEEFEEKSEPPWEGQQRGF